MNTKEKLAACPIWQRASLTLEVASAYTGIGVNKLRDMSDEPDCDYVFWVKNKRMLKRKKLEKYLDDAYSKSDSLTDLIKLWGFSLF